MYSRYIKQGRGSGGGGLDNTTRVNLGRALVAAPPCSKILLCAKLLQVTVLVQLHLKHTWTMKTWKEQESSF